MKILHENAGFLTNFEVLQFLKSRGATSDPLGSLGAVAPSECKVYDYLVHSAACNQTAEAIHEFLKGSEKYKLLKPERYNIINLRPTSQAEIDPIIEGNIHQRLEQNEEQGIDEVQEVVDLAIKALPPPPVIPGKEGAEAEDMEEWENNGSKLGCLSSQKEFVSG